MISAIGVGDDFWPTHIWKPRKPSTVPIRIEVKSEIAVRARPATGKEWADDELRGIIASVWHRREDRYSELRAALKSGSDKVEMYYIGG